MCALLAVASEGQTFFNNRGNGQKLPDILKISLVHSHLVLSFCLALAAAERRDLALACLLPSVAEPTMSPANMSGAEFRPSKTRGGKPNGSRVPGLRLTHSRISVTEADLAPFEVDAVLLVEDT